MSRMYAERICGVINPAAPLIAYKFFNRLYETNPRYREMIDEERREEEARRAEEERRDAEIEAERDARNPLMTRFTKRVICALEARIAEIREIKHIAAENRNTHAYWDAYCALGDVYDIKNKYEARLAYYQGVREKLPR